MDIVALCQCFQPYVTATTLRHFHRITAAMVEALAKCYNIHRGLPQRVRVAVVVDNNSTTAWRWKPLQVRTFWRRYCTTQPLLFAIDIQKNTLFILACQASIDIFYIKRYIIFQEDIPWNITCLTEIAFVCDV